MNLFSDFHAWRTIVSKKVWFWSLLCSLNSVYACIESPKNQSPSLREGVGPTKLPSNPEEVEDLRRDTGVNPLIAFTFNELKVVTGNFRQENLLGGGGFGSVYRGFIGEDLKKEGLEPLQIAVKVHDGDNSFQGHREWLVWL